MKPKTYRRSLWTGAPLSMGDWSSMHCIIITIFHWLIYIYFLLVHFFLACLFYCLLGWYALHHHYQGSFIFHWLHMHTFSLFIFFSNFSLINCLLVFFFLAHIFLLYYPQHGWLCKHALHHHYYLSLIDCILFTFCCFLLLSYFCFFCLYSFAYLAFSGLRPPAWVTGPCIAPSLPIMSNESILLGSIFLQRCFFSLFNFYN